jgi:hypothetical protein
MNSGFGNLNWQIFVYLSYFIVVASLFAYVTYAYVVRKKSIEALSREGFLEEDKKDETQ